MVTDYRKIDLFGKIFIQRLALQAPFEFTFPVSTQACFLYMLEGEMNFESDGDAVHIATNYSLLLNCVHGGRQIKHADAAGGGHLVIVTFHPEVLQKIYEKDLPALLHAPAGVVSNQSSEKINNDFLIQKYMEGLLFYFDNPSLLNDDILVLKLKEIILLLAQSQTADTIQVILSQLFSPATFTFKQVIEANLFLSIGIEALAQKTNLSVSSFKREFSKLYNDSPGNYIKNRRLEKAAELLLASNKRIGDIAFDCGFNDLANFTKSFHEKYQLAPTSYRVHHQQH